MPLSSTPESFVTSMESSLNMFAAQAAATLSSSSPSTASSSSKAAGSTQPIHACPEPNCQRRFNRKYTLIEHIKSHTGEKPHICPVRTCGKRFSTSGNLSRHKRLHGYIQPLECPVEGCLSSFPSTNKLEKHMKFHLGSAVHVCTIDNCGKTFSTTGNLNRHVKHQHGSAFVSSNPLPALQTNYPSPTRIDGSRETTSASFPRLPITDTAKVMHGPPQHLPHPPARGFFIEPVRPPPPPFWHSDKFWDASPTGRFDVNMTPTNHRVEPQLYPADPSKANILDEIVNFHVEHFGY